jgi:hypothetical protein
LYALPSGTAGDVIGVGPDDTIYVLLARAAPTPVPTPAGLSLPDVKIAVDAIGKDGSHKTGWPADGVAVAGYPLDYRLAGDGTVYVASGARPIGAEALVPSSVTITAIGPNGKVLAGWPYQTPKALHYVNREPLVFGPDGRVCITDMKPGSASGDAASIVIYCVGRDGKTLAGWPYSFAHHLAFPAFGADGTLYVEQIVPAQGVTNWPNAVIALDPNGKPKPGWINWSPENNEPLSAILPAANGEVYVVVGGVYRRTSWVRLSANGGRLAGPIAPSGSICHSAVLAADGTLLVATEDHGPTAAGAPAGYSVFAFAADGSTKAGWPVEIGGFGDLFLSPDGSVWAAWIDPEGLGGPETVVVAAFDRDGRLRAGFPMETGLFGGGRIVFDSGGTAYAAANSASGREIVVIGS